MAEIIIQKTMLADAAAIATVTFDNSSRLNCIDSKLARQLALDFEQLAQEPSLRAVCLRGAGQRAFIGGADIREMADLTPESARTFITTLHEACAAIRNLPVPVIAQISGYCLGAGLEIAASCDLRIADTSASFAMPEVQIGLPSVIEAALLPRLVGWGRASRLVYTGESIDADTASKWGLIEQLTSIEALQTSVDQTLATIARADSDAVRLQKQLLRDWAMQTVDESIRKSIEVFPQAFETRNPGLRMHAFLNRKNN